MIRPDLDIGLKKHCGNEFLGGRYGEKEKIR